MRMNIIFLRVFPFFARREAIKCHPACYWTDLKKRVSYRHFSADCPISWIFVMKEACGLSSLHEMQLLSQMFFLQLSSRKYHVIPREGLWKKRRSKPRAQRFGKVDLEDVDRDDIEAFRDRHQILFLSYVISGTRCPAARILCVRSPGKIRMYCNKTYAHVDAEFSWNAITFAGFGRNSNNARKVHPLTFTSCIIIIIIISLY